MKISEMVKDIQQTRINYYEAQLLLETLRETDKSLDNQNEQYLKDEKSNQVILNEFLRKSNYDLETFENIIELDRLPELKKMISSFDEQYIRINQSMSDLKLIVKNEKIIDVSEKELRLMELNELLNEKQAHYNEIYEQNKNNKKVLTDVKKQIQIL